MNNENPTTIQYSINFDQPSITTGTVTNSTRSMKFEVTEEEMISIQGYPRYTISSNGVVFDTKRKNFISAYVHTMQKGKQYKELMLTGFCGKKKLVKQHRLIAIHFIPNPEGKPYIDHIDGNGLNNSLKNLRWVTPQENSQNMKSHKGSSSQYIGVKWHTASGKWASQIFVNGKLKHLGTFTSEEEAAHIYNTAAVANGFLSFNQID